MQNSKTARKSSIAFRHGFAGSRSKKLPLYRRSQEICHGTAHNAPVIDRLATPFPPRWPTKWLNPLPRPYVWNWSATRPCSINCHKTIINYLHPLRGASEKGAPLIASFRMSNKTHALRHYRLTHTLLQAIKFRQRNPPHHAEYNLAAFRRSCIPTIKLDTEDASKMLDEL